MPSNSPYRLSKREVGVAGDPTTFTFKPNTIADMDNNGAYDASVDAGANTATAGLVALP